MVPAVLARDRLGTISQESGRAGPAMVIKRETFQITNQLKPFYGSHNEGNYMRRGV